MNAYEALTAAYAEKAKLAGGNADAGMGNLFDEIAGFAESDVEQTAATAHELEFLAGVLSLAARNLIADGEIARSQAGAPGVTSAAEAGGRKPSDPAYAVVFQEENVACSHAFTGARARENALGLCPRDGSSLRSGAGARRCREHGGD